MPKFAANLTMLFTEQPFLDRFAACAQAGFKYVEYMFPYEYEPDVLRGYLQRNNLEQVLFNLPAGDWQAGDRGIAADPSRVDEFRAGVTQAVTYARALGVPRVNCLVGKAPAGATPEDSWRVLVDNFAFAAAELDKVDVALLVEAINTFDIPGFLINNTKLALQLIDAVATENFLLQYDAYHMQRMEGELTATIRGNLSRIGHIQIADNPGRNQPGTGEINYRYLLEEIDRMGYGGYVGLEYKPAPDTLSSLGWIQQFGFGL